jgi:predicted GIY-YIG superfamily endonuclease
MRNRKKPSTLSRFIKAIGDMVETEAEKKAAPKKPYNSFARQSGLNSKPVTSKKTCQYWNCNTYVRSNHFLCTEHYEDYQEYVIDKCPECGRFKDVGFDVCKDCYSALKQRTVDKKSKSPIRREYSKTWEKGDQGVENFFVYILKDEQGEFYSGQTRDLRIRYGYHTDRKVKSTAGRKQKLVYYETLSSRQQATSREIELKTLIKTNEFTIRKMIQVFADNHKLITLD